MSSPFIFLLPTAVLPSVLFVAILCFVLPQNVAQIVRASSCHIFFSVCIIFSERWPIVNFLPWLDLLRFFSLLFYIHLIITDFIHLFKKRIYTEFSNLALVRKKCNKKTKLLRSLLGCFFSVIFFCCIGSWKRTLILLDFFYFCNYPMNCAIHHIISFDFRHLFIRLLFVLRFNNT